MMQHKKITPVYYNVEDVGKNIKQTKKRFTWMLEMDQKMYTFVLDASMISGKVKLTCNNQIVAMSDEQPLGTFSHTMLLDTYQIVIVAVGQTYEMRINNQVFSHMLNQIKTKSEFVKNEQACEDIVVDQKITRSATAQNGLKKTIKLKIGSMKPTSKSSVKSVESEDWSKMMGDEANSFPNYFDLEKGGLTPQQIDYSKVSMKKKPTQPEMPKPEESMNLMEDNTHVIEITPEQFSTMQQMFRTQVPMQMMGMPQSSSGQVPKSEGLQKEINAHDFSTMQMLFQSQCGTALSKDDTPSTEPVEISINIQDFSTMQWMFNTMNCTPQTMPSEPKKQEQPPKASFLLDQVCSKAQSPQSTPSFNMADFSTMQMMFATNNMNMFNQPPPTTSSPLSLLTMAQQTETKPSVPTLTQMNSMPEPNAMDFNTMANMFKTMNLSQPPMMQIPSQQVVSDPLSALGLSNSSKSALSNSSNNANSQQINMSDFSTMQNLFKTNGMGLNLGMPKPSTSTTANELKENSVPFQFQF